MTSTQLCYLLRLDGGKIKTLTSLILQTIEISEMFYNKFNLVFL
jgi:hypothetical protein